MAVSIFGDGFFILYAGQPFDGQFQRFFLFDKAEAHHVIVVTTLVERRYGNEGQYNFTRLHLVAFYFCKHTFRRKKISVDQITTIIRFLSDHISAITSDPCIYLTPFLQLQGATGSFIDHMPRLCNFASFSADAKSLLRSYFV